MANKEPGQVSILWDPQESLEGEVGILGFQEWQTQITVYLDIKGKQKLKTTGDLVH